MRTLADTPHDPEKGLSSSAVQSSRERFGRNALTPLPREPLWKKFLEKFDEPWDPLESTCRHASLSIL